MVASVAWSPDGNLLASVGGDSNVLIWDVNNGEKLRTLTGGTDVVNSIAWSPNGKRLASGCDDGTIRLWGIP